MADLSPTQIEALAAAMLDAQAARATAAANAPRETLRAQLVAAYPTISTVYTMEPTANGAYALLQLPKGGPLVRLLPSKKGFMAVNDRGGDQIHAETEEALLSALARIAEQQNQAQRWARGGASTQAAPPAATPAPKTADAPAAPKYRFSGPNDVSWGE